MRLHDSHKFEHNSASLDGPSSDTKIEGRSISKQKGHTPWHMQRQALWIKQRHKKDLISQLKKDHTPCHMQRRGSIGWCHWSQPLQMPD